MSLLVPNTLYVSVAGSGVFKVVPKVVTDTFTINQVSDRTFKLEGVTPDSLPITISNDPPGIFNWSIDPDGFVVPAPVVGATSIGQIPADYNDLTIIDMTSQPDNTAIMASVSNNVGDFNYESSREDNGLNPSSWRAVVFSNAENVSFIHNHSPSSTAGTNGFFYATNLDTNQKVKMNASGFSEAGNTHYVFTGLVTEFAKAHRSVFSGAPVALKVGVPYLIEIVREGSGSSEYPLGRSSLEQWRMLIPGEAEQALGSDKARVPTSSGQITIGPFALVGPQLELLPNEPGWEDHYWDTLSAENQHKVANEKIPPPIPFWNQSARDWVNLTPSQRQMLLDDNVPVFPGWTQLQWDELSLTQQYYVTVQGMGPPVLGWPAQTWSGLTISQQERIIESNVVFGDSNGII